MVELSALGQKYFIYPSGYCGIRPGILLRTLRRTLDSKCPTRDVMENTMRALKHKRKGHTDRGDRRTLCRRIACHTSGPLRPYLPLGPPCGGIDCPILRASRRWPAAAEYFKPT